jgi:hypothetical protein
MSCFLNNGHKSCPLSKDGGQAHKPSVEDCAHSNWILLSALFVLFIRCIVYLIHFLTRLIHPLYCKSYSFSHTSYSSAVMFYLIHFPTHLIHPLYCLFYSFSHTSYSSAVSFILFIYPHVLFIRCIVYLIHFPRVTHTHLAATVEM